MDNTTTLKPCPFCGGAASIVDLEVTLECDGGWQAQCNGCGIASNLAYCAEAEAIAAWNHRPTEQALLEALKEMFACVEYIGGGDLWRAEKAREILQKAQAS